MVKELKAELDTITGIADIEAFWLHHRIKDFGVRANMLEEYCKSEKIKYDDDEVNYDAAKQKYYSFLYIFLSRHDDKR